jgi:multidrug efflux pump subunit AcrB
MAIGVIGGLIFSICLTFYYMPIVFMAIMENKNK